MSAADERAVIVLEVLRRLGGWRRFDEFHDSCLEPPMTPWSARSWPIPETAMRTRLKQLEAAGLVERRGAAPKTEWRAVAS